MNLLVLVLFWMTMFQVYPGDCYQSVGMKLCPVDGHHVEAVVYNTNGKEGGNIYGRIDAKSGEYAYPYIVDVTPGYVYSNAVTVYIDGQFVNWIEFQVDESGEILVTDEYFRYKYFFPLIKTGQ